jgi:DNA-binding SARP family transcriptional activator
LLGGFALDCGGAPTEVLPRAVQRLVAYLGLSRAPARTAVAGHLWPDVPEERAYGNLRTVLWRLQKAAPGLVDVSGDAMSLASGVRIDVREMTDWAHRALDPARDVEWASLPQVGLSAQLLPGWYDDWVLVERERCRQLRLYALERMADKLAAQGRYGEGVQVACAAIQDEPLRETAHRTLVRIHLADGNVAEAIRTYESFRELLAAELGVSPTAQMNSLFCRIGRVQTVGNLVPLRRA